MLGSWIQSAFGPIRIPPCNQIRLTVKVALKIQDGVAARMRRKRSQRSPSPTLTGYQPQTTPQQRVTKGMEPKPSIILKEYIGLRGRCKSRMTKVLLFPK